MHRSIGVFQAVSRSSMLSVVDQSRPLPFLKWAGGKRWLTHRVQELTLAPNGTYFEPFLGSAAMFFHWGPQVAVLSDANSALIETYCAIKDSAGDVVCHLKKHARKHSPKHYYATRSAVFDDVFERAAQFIYLNRTCWNGLYRVNRSGEFNVPIGTKQNVLLATDDFQMVAEKLKTATLLCEDFEVQIDKSAAGDFVFADPPYTVRHKHNGFVKYNEQLFEWDDQIRLRNAIARAKSRGVQVLVSNADHESIRELYSGFRLDEVSRYSAIAGAGTKRGSFDELLIS